MFFKKDEPAAISPTNPASLFYAIYDVKSMQIFQGFLRILPSDGAAERWFTDMMCHKETVIHAYPTDFVLVRVGVIDTDTLACRSYGVGITEPVITGAALLRRLQAGQTPLDQPLLAQQEASSDSRQADEVIL